MVWSSRPQAPQRVVLEPSGDGRVVAASLLVARSTAPTAGANAAPAARRSRRRRGRARATPFRARSTSRGDARRV